MKKFPEPTPFQGTQETECRLQCDLLYVSMTLRVYASVVCHSVRRCVPESTYPRPIAQGSRHCRGAHSQGLFDWLHCSQVSAFVLREQTDYPKLVQEQEPRLSSLQIRRMRSPTLEHRLR